LPSNSDWTQLTDYLGGIRDAGGKLKESGTTHWNSPNTGSTNETGFTALPGAVRSHDGEFDYVGKLGVWWSATESNSSYARTRTMFYKNSGILSGEDYKEWGCSVSCVRDSF